jgi:putative Mn2+ efflux pump MntP
LWASFNILRALLFAVCANMDNLSIGISYGIQKIKVSFLPNLIIALITLFGTALSMLAGAGITSILSPDTAKIIGGVILIIIGLYYILKVVFKKIIYGYDATNQKPLCNITIRESIAIGIALTINNFGMGIGIGTDVEILELIIINVLTFLFSMIFMSIGNFLGECMFSRFFGKFSEFISGVIMVLIGIFQIIG